MSRHVVDGPCAWCNATQTGVELEPDKWLVTTHHEPDCPMVASRTDPRGRGEEPRR